MDVIERLNRRFGAWYEGLFGTSSDRDLRPRDILRRLLIAMEDARREGLDGHIYVPNVYSLQIAVQDDDERDYLRTFLSADDLAAAVRRALEQHGYRLKGGLDFRIEETPAASLAEPSGERVHIRTRFDASIPMETAPALPAAPAAKAGRYVPAAVPEEDEDDEHGTVVGAPGQVLASLIVRDAEGRLVEVYPVGPRGARIGRGRKAGNDIVLADGMVSKAHALLRFDPPTGRFFVRDDGSTNGTYLNGEPLAPGDERPLASGDRLLLGETVLTFRPSGESSLPSSGKPAAFATARAMSAAPLPALPEQPPLALVGEGGAATVLASEMSVGRAVTCDIVVDGEGVASEHARLFRQTPSGGGEERVYIEDLGTDGGTFVNGERIPSHFPVALYAGDDLGFGQVHLRVEQRRGSRAARGALV